MGPKITIDSATLANKGLEVIEAHFLFGVAYDRIEVVVHPTSIVHGLVRFRDGAAIAHLGYPDMRVPISYALTYPDRAPTPVPPLDLTAGPLEFHEPDTETFPLLALAREAGERGGTFPCAYNAANEVAVQGFLDGRIGFLEIASRVEDVLARVDGAPARDLDELVEADRRARELVPGRMSVVISILGLALLILVHEAGHFFAAKWVGMKPRKFYIGFGAPIAKTTRGGVEYGIGSIPLGGYVKIPGMQRPAPGDLRRSLPPADRERLHEHLERLDEAIERGDDEAARARLADLEPHAGQTRAFQELDGALSPEAYWRQATWRRITAIAAGPAANVIAAVALFAGLFMVGTIQVTPKVDAVVANPAQSSGMQPGDRIVAIGGRSVDPEDIPDAINATGGRPVAVVVDRAGKRLTLGPMRPRLDGGRYRIGFRLQGEIGPGESPPAAVKDALSVTWEVTTQTGSSVGRLATGKGSDEISSSVGIVRVSSQAFKQGLRDFLSVLGLISLALALLNLLPVLPLDGGHIVMAVAERVRGRAFSQAVYIRYSAIGFALFAVLLYLGLRNDLFGGAG